MPPAADPVPFPGGSADCALAVNVKVNVNANATACRQAAAGGGQTRFRHQVERRPRNTAALDEFERLKTIGTGTQRLCARERSLERTLTSTTRLTINVRHVRVCAQAHSGA